MGLSKVFFRAPRIPHRCDWDRRRSVPWVQVREPGDHEPLSSGSRLRVPASARLGSHVSASPPSTPASCSRSSRTEVATSVPGLGSLAAPPEGLAQPSCPDGADANLPPPAFRPRRFSRPRRFHCIPSAVPRHASDPTGRRVSATSSRTGSVRALQALTCVAPAPLNRLRLAPRLASDPKVPGLGWAADHGVHRVSGPAAVRASPLGAASVVGHLRPLDALLPLGAFTPCGRICSPEQLTIHTSGSLVSLGLVRLAACCSVHTSARPSRRCLAAVGLSRLARHHAFASRGSLDHPCPSPIAASLARCRFESRSAARFRAAVSSPRPQGTSAGSGPACVFCSIRR